MNKIVMAIAGGVLAGTLVTTQVAGPLLAQENSQKANIYQQLDLFGDIFERIRGQYVEEVDAADLIEAAIDGMLSSLDPHSSYLSPEDAADMRVQTRGEFGGLGIEVTQEEGFVKVVSPIDDTPADEAGIEAGDFITHVDGDSVLGLSLDEAVGMMRGVVGSEIVITVVREGEDEPFDVTIVRDTIKLTAVRTRVEGECVVDVHVHRVATCVVDEASVGVQTAHLVRASLRSAQPRQGRGVTCIEFSDVDHDGGGIGSQGLDVEGR